MHLLRQFFCAALFIVAACKTSSDSLPCGDGTIITGEECDDGNSSAGDGCSSICAVENGYLCDGRPSVCTSICGDGVIIADEVCDDGNLSAEDGCSSVCTVETGFLCDGTPSLCEPICADGMVVAGEPCDDGHELSGDGCSSVCTVETGFTCDESPSVCEPICGDGTILTGEACDDGNTTAGDGCSSVCTVEAGFVCTINLGLSSCHCDQGYYRTRNACAQERACASDLPCDAPGLCVDGMCRSAPTGCEGVSAKLATDGAPCPGALSMLLWLDASETSLVRHENNQANVADTVTEWHDRSGNGKTAIAFKNSTTDRSPALQKNGQGQPYLYFDGTSFMEVRGVDVTAATHTSITSIMVVQPLSSSSTVRVEGEEQRNHAWVQQANFFKKRQHFLPDKVLTGTLGVHSMTDQVATSAGVSTETRDEWLAGVRYLQDASRLLESTSQTGIGLGALLYTEDGNGGAYYSKMYISEIMLFARKLSDADRRAIEQHLIKKWKLKSQATTFTDLQPLVYVEEGVDSSISHTGHRVPRVVDWDGDGLLDLLVANNRSVHFYKNIGSRQVPRFSPATRIQSADNDITTMESLSGIAVVNMGGNARPDLVVSARATDGGPSQLFVYLDTATQGAPALESPAVIRKRNCTGDDATCAFNLISPRFDLADVNGDSHVDLVVGGFSADVNLFLGDSTSSFNDAAPVTLEAGCSYNCYPRLFDLNHSSTDPAGAMDYIRGINWGNITAVANPLFTGQLSNSVDLMITNVNDQTNFGGQTQGEYIRALTDGAIPDFADLNGDGTFDLIFGGHPGGGSTTIMVAYGVSKLGCTTDACHVGGTNRGVCVDAGSSASPAIMCYCDTGYETSISGGCETAQ